MTNTQASRLHRDTADRIAAVPPINDGPERELMVNSSEQTAHGVAMSLEGLTDNQFRMVLEALPHPVILETGAMKVTARSLEKRGRGAVENGASGELIFRLNQEGEDQARWEAQSWQTGVDILEWRT